MKRHLHQRIFDTRQTIRNCSGTYGKCKGQWSYVFRRAMVRCRTFRVFSVNLDL